MALPSQNPAKIAASGGDYTTLAAWEADLDDASLDADYAAEIDGEITGNTSFFGVDGSAGSPDPYKVIIREFDTPAIGTNESTCAKIVGRINITGTTAARYEISGIEVSDEIYGITCGNSHVDTEYTVTKCVILDATTTAGIDIANAHTTNVPVRLGCNLLIDCGSGSFDGGLRLNDASLTTSVLALNNTVYHSAPATNVYGIGEAAGDFGDVRNNAFCLYDNRGANTPIDVFSGTANVSYCASSGDGTATGTGSIDTLRNDGTDWTDTSISDFSLVSDGVLVGAGVTISGESWFPTTDLVGTTWASPPAIGCFEVAGAPPTGRPLPQRVLSGPFSGPLNGVF